MKIVMLKKNYAIPENENDVIALLNGNKKDRLLNEPFTGIVTYSLSQRDKFRNIDRTVKGECADHDDKMRLAAEQNSHFVKKLLSLFRGIIFGKIELCYKNGEFCSYSYTYCTNNFDLEQEYKRDIAV